MSMPGSLPLRSSLEGETTNLPHSVSRLSEEGHVSWALQDRVGLVSALGGI